MDDDGLHLNTESGYSFDNEPAPLTGFGPSQTCSRLFDEIEVPSREKTRIRLLNQGLQIILPEHRIELFHDSNELINEMEREFRNTNNFFRNFWSSVSKTGKLIDACMRDNQYQFPLSLKKQAHYLPLVIMEMFTLLKLLRLLKSSSPLSRVFETMVALLSNYHHENFNSYPLMSSYIFNYPTRGLYYFIGGKNRLRQILLDRFTAWGGSVIRNGDIRKVSVDKKIDVEVTAQDTMMRVRGKNLLVSVKWNKLKRIFALNRKLESVGRHLMRVRKARYPLTLHLGVWEKGLPEKISAYSAVIVHPERSIFENNLIYMETSQSGDRECAPEGKRTLSASIFIKDNPLVIDDSELIKLYEEMLANMEMFLPFLRENIDYMDIGKSIELTRKQNDIVNQKYIMMADPIWGFSRLKNRTTLNNVYLTGGLLLPSLGFEGEVLSGMNAANLLTGKKEEKND